MGPLANIVISTSIIISTSTSTDSQRLITNELFKGLSSNPMCQLHISWEDGYSLSVYHAEVGVFQEPYKIHLCCFM